MWWNSYSYTQELCQEKKTSPGGLNTDLSIPAKDFPLTGCVSSPLTGVPTFNVHHTLKSRLAQFATAIQFRYRLPAQNLHTWPSCVLVICTVIKTEFWFLTSCFCSLSTMTLGKLSEHLRQSPSCLK